MNIPNDESVKHVTLAPDLAVGRLEPPLRASRADQSPEVKKDEITLSEEGKQLQKIIKLIQAAPDVRVEKVVNLQRQIATGTYRVSDDELIDSILALEAK